MAKNVLKATEVARRKLSSGSSSDSIIKALSGAGYDPIEIDQVMTGAGSDAPPLSTGNDLQVRQPQQPLGPAPQQPVRPTTTQAPSAIGPQPRTDARIPQMSGMQSAAPPDALITGRGASIHPPVSDVLKGLGKGAINSMSDLGTFGLGVLGTAADFATGGPIPKEQLPPGYHNLGDEGVLALPRFEEQDMPEAQRDWSTIGYVGGALLPIPGSQVKRGVTTLSRIGLPELDRAALATKDAFRSTGGRGPAVSDDIVTQLLAKADETHDPVVGTVELPGVGQRRIQDISDRDMQASVRTVARDEQIPVETQQALSQAAGRSLKDLRDRIAMPPEVQAAPIGPSGWGRTISPRLLHELSQPMAEGTPRFDDLVAMAEQYKINRRAPNPLSTAGEESLGQGFKQLDKQIDGLAKMKETLLNQATESGTLVDISDIKKAWPEAVRKVARGELTPHNVVDEFGRPIRKWSVDNPAQGHKIDPDSDAALSDITEALMSLPDQVPAKLADDVKRYIQHKRYSSVGLIPDIADRLSGQFAGQLSAKLKEALGPEYSNINASLHDHIGMEQILARVLGKPVDIEQGLHRNTASIMRLAGDSITRTDLQVLFNKIRELTNGKYDPYQASAYAEAAMRIVGDEPIYKPVDFAAVHELKKAASKGPIEAAWKSGTNLASTVVKGLQGGDDAGVLVNYWKKAQGNRLVPPAGAKTEPAWLKDLRAPDLGGGGGGGGTVSLSRMTDRGVMGAQGWSGQTGRRSLRDVIQQSISPQMQAGGGARTLGQVGTKEKSAKTSLNALASNAISPAMEGQVPRGRSVSAPNSTSIIPKNSEWSKGTDAKLAKVEVPVTVRANAPRETRVYEVSLQPSTMAKVKDKKAGIDVRDVKTARAINASPERVAGWAKTYSKAQPMDVWADVKKVSKDGKLADVPVVSLTKGCQRTLTTAERVENGVLPRETRIEACYGGSCWVNKQFNSAFSAFENMEVRDLKLATKDRIGEWLSKPKTVEWLNSGPFVRMGQQGDDSHLIATGLAEEWLKQAKANGVKKKTVMISAGYAPVTKEQYAALKPYAKDFELHLSNSGWFHRNEIMLRLGEYQAAKEAGLPAKIRLITNKDGIGGLTMENDKFLKDKLREMKVPQEDILETPYHDDGARGKPRSEPTGDYKYICCETGACKSCGAKCMVNTGIPLAASVATSGMLIKLNNAKSEER
jgi:hypothetical protein